MAPEPVAVKQTPEEVAAQKKHDLQFYAGVQLLKKLRATS